MLTEEEKPDPWLLEDVELRFKTASDYFLAAIEAFEKVQAAGLAEPYGTYVTNSLKDARRIEQLCTALRCYCREGNLAEQMRMYVADKEPIPQALIDRFTEIMQIDIANQAKGIEENTGNQATAETMLALFQQNPAAWVSSYLLLR